MTKRLRKTWRHLSAWVQGLVVLASVIGLGVGVALAIDTDNDGMSDEFESFFGLNPAVNDAAQDPDGDTLSNFAESLRWSDPWALDTDGDLVSDGCDSNPVSRAVIPWGDQTFTQSNDVFYTWPDWCLAAFKVGGQWQSDTNGAAWWSMSATSAPNSGCLYMDVDRGLLTNNLRLDLVFRDHSNATFYLDLYDTNDAVVVSNLMGNLLHGSGVDTNTTLHIPLQSWTNAVGISLRRGQGEARVYSSVLYVDEDGDGLDSDMEVQLGLSDYDVTNTAPFCAITSPNSGSVYASPASVVIAVSASDADGSIVRVEFFDGATKIGEDTTSPYQCLWTNMAPGGYPLSAVATDNDGASSTSELAVVILNSPGGGGLRATASGSPTYGTAPMLSRRSISDGLFSNSPSNTLVACYPFNGNAKDKSRNKLHGKVYGATLTQGTCGHDKTAYRFDGVDDYIDLGTNSALKMTNAITISLWAKIDSFSRLYQNVISDHAGNEIQLGCGKILRFRYSSLQFHVGGAYGMGTGIYIAATLPEEALGQWVHIVGTYNREVVRLYVNGAKVAERTYSEPLRVNLNPLLIGKSGFGEFLQGSIDQVRIYNRALSDMEVSQLYRSERRH